MKQISFLLLLINTLALGQSSAQRYQSQVIRERQRSSEAAQRYQNQVANDRMRSAEAAQRYQNQLANDRRLASEAVQRYQNQQTLQRQQAAEAVQRYQNQQTLQRQQAAEAVQRYRVQREVQQANERQQAAAAMQRYQLQKENERQQAAAAMQRYQAQKEIERQQAAEAMQRYQMQRQGSQPSYSIVSPAPRTSTSIDRSQATPLDSGTVAINGVRVPKGATHYLVQGSSVRYFGNEVASTPVAPTPVAAVPAAPAPEVIPAPPPELPNERFAPLFDGFANDADVGLYASLLIFDEPIGPLSLDKPVYDAPALSEDIVKEMTKDRFTTVKALFDNASLPDLASLPAKSGWSGRCVLRSAPTIELAAVIGFSDEATEKKVTLYVGATATLSSGIRPLVESSEREWRTLTDETKKNRHFVEDALFFDFPTSSFGDTQKLGYRLRKIVAVQGKEFLVLEGYSPVRDDVAIAGKRVSHLEPLRYCYFSQTERWN